MCVTKELGNISGFYYKDREFMKKVIIKHFKEKHQERITFIRTLISYKSDLGLKGAKDILDNMLDGEPIQYDISNEKLNEFLNELDKLNLEYEVN